MLSLFVKEMFLTLYHILTGIVNNSREKQEFNKIVLKNEEDWYSLYIKKF